MLSLCAERQGADAFDQIDGLASGHKRDRFAVHCGKAVLTIVAIERQRKRREVLVTISVARYTGKKKRPGRLNAKHL